MVSTTIFLRHSTRKAGVIIMQEIWKDIEGYEGLYKISNLGRIMSFHKIKNKPNQEYHYMTPTNTPKGYKAVVLIDSQKNAKRYLIHRLVALAFLDNPNNYRCVNHKDENKSNNSVDNLEWCSYYYNNRYGSAKIRARITRSRKVSQYTAEGVWIATYASPSIAAELLKCDRHTIKRCCDGKLFTAIGYIWKYDDLESTTS